MSDLASGAALSPGALPHANRVATRVASFAILAVLLALGACAAWGAAMTYRADVAVKRATEASNAIEQARKGFAAERMARRTAIGLPRGQPGDDLKARHREASTAIVNSLQTARVFTDGTDRRLVDELAARHGLYLRAAGAVWGEAADESVPLRVFNPARADGTRTDATLTTLEADADQVSERLRMQALGLLQLLIAIQTQVFIGGPVLFVLGLVLVGALWRMQRSEQRAGTTRLVQDAYAVSQTERRFRGVVHHAPAAMLLCAGPGSVIYGNAAALVGWSYTAAQLEGQSILMLAHPEDRTALRAWWEDLRPAEDALATDTSEMTPAAQPMVLRLRDGAGAWRWVQLVGANLLEEAGVQGMILMVHPAADPQSIVQQAAAEALLDPLTRLPNQALLRDRLGQAMARAGRRTDKVGLLMIDLQPVGIDAVPAPVLDSIVLEAATRIQACVRPQDTVARLGDLQFAVVRDASGDEAEIVLVAEALAAQFGRKLPGGATMGEIAVVVRVGVVAGDPRQDTIDGLLRNGDLAMQRVPAGGEPRHVVFQSGARSDVLDRVELEGDLRGAVLRLLRGETLDTGEPPGEPPTRAGTADPEVRVHYQPIVSLRTGHVCGFEALMRWHHPLHGMVPSSTLFPMAEETGMIVPLGHWVLEEACRQVVRWQAQFGDASPLTLGVNLSSQQFRRPGLVADVTRALAGSGLPPPCLRLELTEATIIRDADHAVRTLWKLKELGVQLAIDDFGGGYSALPYLKQLPIGLLKIDGSFVRGIGQDQEDTSIVRAVMSLAKSLGWGVTAEGIETAAQAQLLDEWGCDFGQGYHFGRPLDGPETTDFLAETGPARPIARGRARTVPA